MAEVIGVNRTNDFSKIISVDNVDGIRHGFEILNMIMPGFSIWKAEEMGGEYEFEVLAKPKENQAVAMK